MWIAIAAAWGLAEATLFFVVPDVLLSWLAGFRPQAVLRAVAACLGLPGIAIAYLVAEGARQPLFWWALLAALVSSIGIGAISRSTKIKEDTAIGIVFAGMFALGIALISTVRSYTVDLAHFLFGNVLGVSSSDLWLMGIFGGLVILSVAIFYKEFLVLSFDPILATTLRLPGRILDNLLLILIATTIVVSLQTVGVALMVAMLITPAATAYLVSRRLPVR